MKQLRNFSTRRLEALSDGVFAIAMTLLVLDLAVPVADNIHNSQQLWEALAPLTSNIVSFTISFAILAIMWGVHVRQFEGIKRIDDRVLVYNNIRLFIVVLIPFTASLLSAYNEIRLAQFIYPLNLFALALMGYIQGRYLNKHPGFFENFNKAEVAAGGRRSLAFVVCAGIAVIGSLFIGSWACLAFLLSPFVIKFLPKRG